MDRIIEVANHRNYGFWNESEQQALAESTVAIAGVGGDGYQLGLKLAMMGVGEIRVADPEVFEPENSNRVLGATAANIGRNKAESFKELVESLPRNVRVTTYTEGVSEDNVEEFTHGADLLLDESELRYLHIGTMLSRMAMKQHIPELLVMNVGFAGIATSFDSKENSKTFEDMMGIPKGAPLDEVAEMELNYHRALPYIPSYGDYNAFVSVVAGAPLPSISQGVDIASGIGSTEAFLHLTSHVHNKRRAPTWAPKFRYFDAYLNKGGIIKHPVSSHYRGAASLYLKSKLGINPRASYGDEDRKRRGSR